MYCQSVLYILVPKVCKCMNRKTLQQKMLLPQPADQNNNFLFFIITESLNTCNHRMKRLNFIFECFDLILLSFDGLE